MLFSQHRMSWSPKVVAVESLAGWSSWRSASALLSNTPVEIALRKGAKRGQVAVEEYGHALCGCRIVLPTGHNNDYNSHSDVL